MSVRLTGISAEMQPLLMWLLREGYFTAKDVEQLCKDSSDIEADISQLVYEAMPPSCQRAAKILSRAGSVDPDLIQQYSIQQKTVALLQSMGVICSSGSMPPPVQHLLSMLDRLTRE